jgi:hypothetical protein
MFIPSDRRKGSNGSAGLMPSVTQYRYHNIIIINTEYSTRSSCCSLASRVRQKNAKRYHFGQIATSVMV